MVFINHLLAKPSKDREHRKTVKGCPLLVPLCRIPDCEKRFTTTAEHKDHEDNDDQEASRTLHECQSCDKAGLKAAMHGRPNTYDLKQPPLLCLYLVCPLSGYRAWEVLAPGPVVLVPSSKSTNRPNMLRMHVLLNSVGGMPQTRTKSERYNFGMLPLTETTSMRNGGKDMQRRNLELHQVLMEKTPVSLLGKVVTPKTRVVPKMKGPPIYLVGLLHLPQ